MKRSNLIPITRIYDIYPKYTYSDDVKKFMDEIVDIDRADVYSKDEADAAEKLKKIDAIVSDCLSPCAITPTEGMIAIKKILTEKNNEKEQ